jgi:uncharacterized protein YlaI
MYAQKCGFCNVSNNIDDEATKTKEKNKTLVTHMHKTTNSGIWYHINILCY